VLGDNIFYGEGFRPMLQKAAAQTPGATLFAYQVIGPECFGVVEFDEHRKMRSRKKTPCPNAGSVKARLKKPLQD